MTSVTEDGSAHRATSRLGRTRRMLAQWDRRPPGWRPVAAVGIVFASLVVLLLRHNPSGAPWKSLYAEDGSLFVQCNENDGLATCLTQPYGGYFHLVPRLLAALVTTTPVPEWPRVAGALAIVLAALALSVIFVTTRWLIPGGLLRAAAVLVAASSAALHREVLGNLANIHWLLLISACFLAVNPRPSSHVAASVARCVWFALTCLSEALAPVVLLAFVAGIVLRPRAEWRPRSADWVAGSIIAACSVVQVVAQFVRPRVPYDLPSLTMSFAAGQYPRAVAIDGWAGRVSASESLATLAFVLVGAVLIIGVAALLLRRTVPATRSIVCGAALVVASLAQFVVTVVVNDAVGDRYIASPFVLLSVGTTAVVAGCYTHLSRPARAVPVLAAAIVLAATVHTEPVISIAALLSPNWREEITDARKTCHRHPDGRVRLDTSPTQPPGVWFVSVPCASLDD